jgi:hypothetical protein
VTSLEINYCPVRPTRRLDGLYRFVGRGGVVAVGHHLFAEEVDRLFA